MLDLKSTYPDFYRFYGRRVAKKLSDKSIESINYYFESSSFDEEVINSFNERKSLKIDKKFQKISLEVGFGNGEFLIKQSNLNKDSLFIGCEVYLNGFSKVLKKINSIIDLTPSGIRDHLNLHKPIYKVSAAYGHFGREPGDDGSFSWEKTDLVDQLKNL